ncbi:hypothetical protein EFR29_05340, partial [Lactobacillus delbrueckii subsp. lactis]|nr:hypothetical protein [Lactobacillus delbrueckii subsp. lactis]
CVFVVINIVRDNPSFFVAYFLFTQEFILNQKFGAGNVYFKSTNLKKMNFVLKKGKVYVYPQVYGYNMDKYFTLPARYK